MQAAEKLFLQTVGRVVADRFKAWSAPIVERITNLEARPAFTDEQTAIVREMIAAAVKDAANDDSAGNPRVTADMVDAKIADALSGLAVGNRIVGGFINRAGDLHFTNSDGSVFAVGHVAGADADPAKIIEAVKAEVAKLPPPKDGKDGFALTDFEVVLEGRTLTFAFKDAGGVVKTESVTATWPIYKGVWIEGDYLAGDSVTHEGSTWIAHVDTATRPGTPGSNWQLAVKRGRDGKEGKAGKPGEAGTPGRDGRDLTQLGPDGSKW